MPLPVAAHHQALVARPQRTSRRLGLTQLVVRGSSDASIDLDIPAVDSIRQRRVAPVLGATPGGSQRGRPAARSSCSVAG
jgi:hypothetical protein